MEVSGGLDWGSSVGISIDRSEVWVECRMLSDVGGVWAGVWVEIRLGQAIHFGGCDAVVGMVVGGCVGV